MAEGGKPPGYMAQLLDALGWNQGTRIPLADTKNQELETVLIERQTEIQRLKEAIILQTQKCNDLDNYKDHVLTEYQENTRLLFAHKQQMEQEVKLKQLSMNEADSLERSVIDSNKQARDIETRIDRFQKLISDLLKKADSMKSEVCGERGALDEWRAALERFACDITAMEQFTKLDNSKAKALETKRQKLKLEYDRTHERLVQLVSNLRAEESACDRISIQVVEGMEERKQIMTMWTSAVENLRLRDKDIRHIREDYALLEKEANNLAEQCREQQAFCNQHRDNNNESRQENMMMATRLSQIRMSYQRLVENNATLDSEVKCVQRELSNMQSILERLHAEKRSIIDEQIRRDTALQATDNRITELKEKLKDSLDKSKSSEKRARELEDLLNEEERYASQITTNQQRAMHCSFNEQQKLLQLQNEEKLFHMQNKATKAMCAKLEYKKKGLLKLAQGLKESLYLICYQVETIGSRVSHMEGAQSERECSAELAVKETRMKEVCALHEARVSLLERHSAKLQDDMRRLTRELEQRSAELARLQSRLKSAMLSVEGGETELASARTAWRRLRVEESLTRLRVAHAARAVARLDDAAFGLDEQRLQIEAAMNERIVEIGMRRDMFTVQKRALFEDCGKLHSEIREREQRIGQLIKRYQIFMDSLGKDDSGQQLTVTFFKIKFAAEQAELRERGAALDAEIGRRERDVSALEATLRVVHAAHQHFIHNISPLAENSPEIEELNGLRNQYYQLRAELQPVRAQIARLEDYNRDADARFTIIADKNRQLDARKNEAEAELETSRERVERQQVHLSHAREIVTVNAKRALKLVEGVDDWRLFQVALWSRDYAEAAQKAMLALHEVATQAPELAARLAALVSATDLKQHVPKNMRRLHALIQKIVADVDIDIKQVTGLGVDASVFSTESSSYRSGASIASGYTRRLVGFRRTLAPKIQEQVFIDGIPQSARRSTVSLRIISLGLDSGTTDLPDKPVPQSRRFSVFK